MNKISFKNSRGLRVVGNQLSVGSKTIIIMAHGFTNDKSSNGRFDQLALALNKAGYDSLAIDFSGSGESEDDSITSEKQVDDLKSAIEFVISQGYSKIALFGNSYGTLACVRSYRKEIVTMVLVGAIMDSMHYNWHEYFSKAQMIDLNEKGFFYTNSNRKHKITKQTLLDFEQINQAALVKKLKCPILIIHGNNSQDEEELQLLSHSQKIIDKLPNNSKLVIIEDGKHGLHEHWGKVIINSIKWYKNIL